MNPQEIEFQAYVHMAAERFPEAIALIQTLGFDVNWKRSSERNMSLLHLACLRGYLEIARVLLSHPEIDINIRSSGEDTPFLLACEFDKIQLVKLLLRFPEVDINAPDRDGRTALWWAAYKGNVSTVKCLVASGRELDMAKVPEYWPLTPRRIAEFRGNEDIASVLKDFESDEERIRYKIREELGMSEALAAELFALTIFVSDQFLALKGGRNVFCEERKKDEANPGICRFFSIAARLPLELQMVLCNRAYGVSKDVILTKDSEVAFKFVARLMG